MAARSEALTTINGGINRLRTQGAALKDSLYDLLNAYVTSSKTVKPRPGTIRYATLPSDTAGDPVTRGLCSFDDGLHVFAAEPVTVPAGFTLHVLAHPDGPDSAGNPIPLTKIHFAAPFLGFLYVVAEFQGGDIFHFWLQTGDVWAASTVYKVGSVVAPSVANGFAYQARRRTGAGLSWAPGVQRAIGDVVEPTEYNNFQYTVVDVAGTNPRSGATEPTWPLEDGAQVTEEADTTPAEAQTSTSATDPGSTPSPVVINRYWGF